MARVTLGRASWIFFKKERARKIENCERSKIKTLWTQKQNNFFFLVLKNCRRALSTAYAPVVADNSSGFSFQACQKKKNWSHPGKTRLNKVCNELPVACPARTVVCRPGPGHRPPHKVKRTFGSTGGWMGYRGYRCCRDVICSANNEVLRLDAG